MVEGELATQLPELSVVAGVAAGQAFGPHPGSGPLQVAIIALAKSSLNGIISPAGWS